MFHNLKKYKMKLTETKNARQHEKVVSLKRLNVNRLLKNHFTQPKNNNTDFKTQ